MRLFSNFICSTPNLGFIFESTNISSENQIEHRHKNGHNSNRWHACPDLHLQHDLLAVETRFSPTFRLAPPGRPGLLSQACRHALQASHFAHAESTWPSGDHLPLPSRSRMFCPVLHRPMSVQDGVAESFGNPNIIKPWYFFRPLPLFRALNLFGFRVPECVMKYGRKSGRKCFECHKSTRGVGYAGQFLVQVQRFFHLTLFKDA